MEKHIDIQYTNILIETDNNQQLVSHDVSIKYEMEENIEHIQEEFTDFGNNIDKYKHNNSKFWIVNRETKSINEFDTTVKTEKDKTVFNDCVFKTEMEIYMPRRINEKEAHSINLIENFNNLHITAGGQVHNCEKEYQFKISKKCLHDKYKFEVKKPYKCRLCHKPFMNAGRMVDHRRSHTGELSRCINEKKAHSYHLIDNFNNLHITAGGQIHNCEKEYQCKISKKCLHDKYKFEVKKLFKCKLCHKPFMNAGRMVDHRRSHTGEMSRCINEKKAHSNHLIENFNNLHITAGGQIHNCEKEYQCKISKKCLHDKYNLEVEKTVQVQSLS